MYKVCCSALGIRSETKSEPLTLYIHSTLYTLLPLIFYRFFLDFSKPDLDDLCRKIVHQIHRSTLYRTIFCLISNLQRYYTVENMSPTSVSMMSIWQACSEQRKQSSKHTSKSGRTAALYSRNSFDIPQFVLKQH